MLHAVPARTFVPGLVLAAAIAGPALAAERPWIEVQSPHFTVVSNAGEGAAQEIAWQFEHVQAVFQTLWPWAHREDGRPFVVIVARDEETLRALAPQFWTDRNKYGTLEAHVSGADADYAAIRVDVPLRGGEVRVGIAVWLAHQHLENGEPLVHLPCAAKREGLETCEAQVVRAQHARRARGQGHHGAAGSPNRTQQVRRPRRKAAIDGEKVPDP